MLDREATPLLLTFILSSPGARHSHTAGRYTWVPGRTWRAFGAEVRRGFRSERRRPPFAGDKRSGAGGGPERRVFLLLKE